MKKTITFFALAALFFVGTYSSTSQEVDKKAEQEHYALKKKQMAEAERMALPPEDVAEQQTENLQELLNLDEKQGIRVYEICLSIEREMGKIPADLADDKRKTKISELESIKSEKLKEALTQDQYTMYLNSIKNEKK
ncbi:MAG: hypothetical protein R2797_14055 [Gelidibacter sp.]